jgi:hypothetical protein
VGEEFVSEPITPHAGTFDAAAMAMGTPGLPKGFDWRERSYAIAARLESWKESSPEGGNPNRERYLRRHCYRLRMDDGSEWTVYCLRQAARGGPGKRRWYLLTRCEGR